MANRRLMWFTEDAASPIGGHLDDAGDIERGLIEAFEILGHLRATEPVPPQVDDAFAVLLALRHKLAMLDRSSTENGNV